MDGGADMEAATMLAALMHGAPQLFRKQLGGESTAGPDAASRARLVPGNLRHRDPADDGLNTSSTLNYENNVILLSPSIKRKVRLCLQGS